MSKLELRYFVLKPKGKSHHAAASRAAMRAYAHYMHDVGDHEMAQHLRSWEETERALAEAVPVKDPIINEVEPQRAAERESKP